MDKFPAGNALCALAMDLKTVGQNVASAETAVWNIQLIREALAVAQAPSCEVELTVSAQTVNVTVTTLVTADLDALRAFLAVLCEREEIRARGLHGSAVGALERATQALRGGE
jgi:hypothetical protein